MEFLCNVVLLVPFAVLGSLVLPRWSWQDWTAWGFLLAGAVELTQGLVLSGRDASYADVVANTLGALLGAWLVVAVRFLAGRAGPLISNRGRAVQNVRRGFVAWRAAPYSRRMSSTWLTKRRAVDHCRVRSSLCRMS